MRSSIKLLTDRRGITALEYALVAAMIVPALVAAMGTFTNGLGAAFSSIAAAFATANK